LCESGSVETLSQARGGIARVQVLLSSRLHF
jgi:hypothetical protein